jgi:hypothetical protein
VRPDNSGNVGQVELGCVIVAARDDELLAGKRIRSRQNRADFRRR